MHVLQLARLTLLSAAFFWSAAQSAEAESVAIEYIAHAAFRISAASGDRVLIDPYGSREWIGYDFPPGVEADAVLITHPHYDHDGGVSRGHDAPWPAEAPVLRDPGRYQVGAIDVTGVAGKHADPYGKEFGQTNTIWVLDIAGLRIVHAGDNGPIAPAAAAEIGRVDVLMLPIDAVYHILKEDEIAAIIEQLRPRILVPMHYRLDDVEPVAGKPAGLGNIDGWLAGRADVRRLTSHRAELSADELADGLQILVFEHSPAVVLSR